MARVVWTGVPRAPADVVLDVEENSRMRLEPFFQTEPDWPAETLRNFKRVPARSLVDQLVLNVFNALQDE